jgi:hypothetical protein
LVRRRSDRPGCDLQRCGVAYDEGAAGCVDDLAGDYGEVAGAQDAFDSGEQPVQEPEVAAGDAGDCGDGLAVGEAGAVPGEAELAVKPRSAGYRSARWPRRPAGPGRRRA